jgi:hypothetical protein
MQPWNPSGLPASKFPFTPLLHQTTGGFTSVSLSSSHYPWTACRGHRARIYLPEFLPRLPATAHSLLAAVVVGLDVLIWSMSTGRHHIFPAKSFSRNQQLIGEQQLPDAPKSMCMPQAELRSARDDGGTLVMYRACRQSRSRYEEGGIAICTAHVIICR